ncbi:hypothetical protein PMI15_02460, partial [Polaromonas sp. CF318]
GGRLYTAGSALPVGLRHQHFGQLIVSCEKADLRPGPSEISIYTDSEKAVEALPAPAIPRREVIDELYAAVVHDKPPVHNGEWARATTAVCLALLESARSGRDCVPPHQVGHNAGS